jgi:peptidoglycan/xylan/chitin deacetylase (PgdA/CDA1 family)
MIPTRTPFILPLLYPSLIWRVDSEKKELYLTFDDGPVAGPTEFVLDVLAKSQSKATFFCIGDNVRKYPHVFNRILNSGHTVGNHTFNHLNGWKTETTPYVQNISLCEDVFDKFTPGRTPRASHLFRPPYGKITKNQIRILGHYKIVMWDVLSHDYNMSLGPESCLRRSISATRNGSIIVFHDSLKAERNMTFALPRFIDHFMEKGYVFKSLPI